MRKILGILLVALGVIFTAPADQVNSKSGKGFVVYKVEMDADEVVQILKANLEAQQITLVDTTNPAAPLSNNVKIFPDFDKLGVSFIQNFLVTSITTLYKIYTVDPNAMVLSPWVITIYQYEDDDYSYIVRTRSSTLLEGTTHPEVLKAVKELESRIDAAIADLL
ncbi:hypothetical protein SAMN06265182_0824 [Persephonella hydrogeniphila]|uniref:DUF302 domain-containing protein n=1 Tax=Persephonella hydrogeniphila TaxID=198703 RepID=A0A285NBJ5_9AQUI|nr:hypothetical protein [Persephonella hydrogeniphila]SNZ06864.1 hypothetical protein SAMN06265182_0824 [Persephonella hydrogeniphila]